MCDLFLCADTAVVVKRIFPYVPSEQTSSAGWLGR
jgi:hypothetical protein